MNDLIIKVKVIKAILTHNTEIGSQMDPFVVLKMGTNQQRGKTFDQAGDMPVFDEQFEFPYQGNLTMFHLIVYDEDATVDDLVGEVQIDLKPIVSQQITPRKWYSLKYDGKKPAGKIMLEFQCDRTGLTKSQNQKITKQLITPNIHHIGPSQQQIHNQIHPLTSRHKHLPQNITSYLDSRIQPMNSIQKPKFSFRDYAQQQEKYKQTPFVKNLTSKTYLNNQALTSSHSLKNVFNQQSYSQRIFLTYQNNQNMNNIIPNNTNLNTAQYFFNGQDYYKPLNNVIYSNSNQSINLSTPRSINAKTFNVIH